MTERAPGGSGWRTAVGGVAGDFATCLRFFSRLPLPPPAPSGGRRLAVAMRMLPLAGLIIGGCGLVPMIFAAAVGLPDLVAAVAALAGSALATGGLHEDGLADVADGFGGGTTRERKLAIMRDSRVGTYGLLAVAIMLLLRASCLAGLLGRAGLLEATGAALAAASVSRSLVLLPLLTLRPVRSDGLGRSAASPTRAASLTGFVLASAVGLGLPVLAGFDPAHAVLACLVATAGAALVTFVAFRQIGGQTGDVAGACQQAAEVGFLLGLLAFPSGP